MINFRVIKPEKNILPVPASQVGTHWGRPHNIAVMHALTRAKQRIEALKKSKKEQ
jgi:hypothetical protein